MVERRVESADEDAEDGSARSREAFRAPIIKLANETGRGHTRILGELKKLGIRSISRTMVLNEVIPILSTT